MHKTLFCAISFLMCPACGDSDGNTTAVITTIITGNPSATEGDETTGPEGPTSTTEATTEAATTEVEPVTTGSEFVCIDEDAYPCEQAPIVRDFCSYLADACGDHGIESSYCSILADKCPATIGCTMCFELTNYCHQLGTGCDNLYLECGCVANGLGVE